MIKLGKSKFDFPNFFCYNINILYILYWAIIFKNKYKNFNYIDKI